MLEQTGVGTTARCLPGVVARAEEEHHDHPLMDPRKIATKKGSEDEEATSEDIKLTSEVLGEFMGPTNPNSIFCISVIPPTPLLPTTRPPSIVVYHLFIKDLLL